jgi:Kef-type K+ transport system membrane component KefB
MVSDPSHLPLSLLLVFGAAKLLAEVCERLNQPGIVGEILAGVLIGPSVLGWVQPNETLTSLAEIGVMFLLFRVGLEVNAPELLKSGGIATLVACLGVVVPFFLGWGLLSMWGQSQIESIFVGASMVATSVGITASVLASKGLLNKRASQIILAAAVIDDVLGLLVLALVSSMAKGRLNAASIALTTAIAAGFVIVVALWGNRTIGRAVGHLRERLRLPEAEFAAGIIVLFTLSLAAVYAGVAAIVGAFMAGLALSGTVEPRMHHLARGANELLVPFFLAGIGLRIDLSTFRNGGILMLTVIIVFVAILSKLVGCGLASLRLGRKDALRIGFGMIPRGEVGMVVAQLGLTMGVISRPIYGVVVAMAVATTIVAPPLIAMAFRKQA